MAIIVISIVMLLASILFYLFVWPDVQRKGTSQSIYVIEKAMSEYAADFEAFPTGDNGEIAELLLGTNDRNKAYLTKKSIPLRKGKLVDFWRRPLRFSSDTDGRPALLSAGPNGEFGDNDDIDSQLIREMVRIAEEKKRENP